jgi:hypothetical protein
MRAIEENPFHHEAPATHSPSKSSCCRGRGWTLIMVKWGAVGKKGGNYFWYQ